MTIGFSIKSWEKLHHGDVIRASKVGENHDFIGKIDGQPTAEDIFAIGRDGMPVVLIKEDGWEVKIRKL